MREALMPIAVPVTGAGIPPGSAPTTGADQVKAWPAEGVPLIVLVPPDWSSGVTCHQLIPASTRQLVAAPPGNRVYDVRAVVQVRASVENAESSANRIR